MKDRLINRIEKKLYIVDDNGAVSVDNENIKIVSEGKSYEIVI